MAESVALRPATISGGISKQPAEVRSDTQVEDALNVDFSLKRGLCSLRAGTSEVAALGTSLAARTWLLSHTIDGTETLGLLGSDGTLRVMNTSGTEATVYVEAKAATYLSTTGSTHRPHTATTSRDAEAIRIANPAVTPLCGASASNIAVTRTHESVDTMMGHTPAAGTYHRALEGSATLPAGLYQYTPGVKSPAVLRGEQISTGGSYGGGLITVGMIRPVYNPMGATIWFGEINFVDDTANNYVAGTKTFGFAGSNLFANWTFAAGRKLFVLADHGATLGAYEITSKVSADYVTLATSPVAGTQIKVVGVGIACDFAMNLAANPPDTAEQLALSVQKAMRDAGATRACCWFEPASLDDNGDGFLHISNHFSGSLAGFAASGNAVHAPSLAGAWDMTSAAGRGLHTSYTLPTLGIGDGVENEPADRWTMIAQPNQSDAVPDPTTLPVSVTAIKAFGAPTPTWDTVTEKLGPVAWWKLEERVGTSAADSAGTNTGTYVGSPTLKVTGLTAAGGYGVTFDGTNDKVTVPAFITPGGTYRGADTSLFNLTAQMTIEMAVICVAGSHGNAITLTDVNSKVIASIRVNDANTALSNGKITITSFDTGIYTTTAAIATLNDGNYHQLTLCLTSGVPTLYFDGVAVALTQTAAPTYAGLTSIAVTIGGGVAYFSGTIDEVAIYHTAFTSEMAQWRAGLLSTALYAVRTSDWASRTTGDATSNPVPTFIKDGTGITALAAWKGRDGIGAGEYFTGTRIDEPTNFFVRDASAVTDGDPVDRKVAPGSTITELKPFGSICFAKTDGQTHYELSGANGAVGPGSLNSRAGLHRPVIDTPSVLCDQRLYVPALSGSTSGGQTLIEAQMDEVAVAGSYEDRGQHVEGLMSLTTAEDLIALSVPADGKILLAERGGAHIYVYQTAYVDKEQRQGAWGVWNIGGTIQCAAEINGGIMLVVLRSGKYLLEKWQPEAASGWPTSSQRMDGRVSVASVSHGGVITTFTMPTNVPATGIDTAVKSDGTVLTATPISATQFTVPGLLHPITVTAGRSLLTPAVRLSRPYVRDQNGQARVGYDVTPAFITATGTDLTKIAAKVTVDSRSTVTYPFTKLIDESYRGRAWTRGPAGRTIVDIAFSGVAPVSVGTIEWTVDATPART